MRLRLRFIEGPILTLTAKTADFSDHSGLCAARANRSGFALVSMLAVAAALTLSGCTTAETSSDMMRVERAQGSEQNIASLSGVISANPSDPEGYNVRGSAYGRAGEFRRALADFNKAIELNPRFYQAYANRALVERNMGDQAAAQADYNMALQLNPRYDVAFIGRGNLYRQAGQLDQAFNDFNKAIELDTTDPRAYHNRGLIYQARKQHTQAIEDFSTAISLAPNSPEPYNGRGISNTAITLNGKIAESWANQALVYERRGDKAKAAKSYSYALKLDPKYELARTGLARVKAGA